MDLIKIRTVLRTDFRKFLSPLIPIYRSARVSWVDAQYGRRPIISPFETNRLIASRIKDGIPTAINRIGLVELDGVRAIQSGALSVDGKLGLVEDPRAILLHKNAGVFPRTAEALKEFSMIYSDAISYSDMTGILYNFGEPRFFKDIGYNGHLFEMLGIDPFLYERPWVEELSGKTVVIASPFEATIKRQTQKMRAIWSNKPSMAPDAEYSTLRVPLSAGVSTPEHPSWKDALEEMLQRLAEINFDVLIAGAGAFAVPLAAAAKRMGKIGINLGGGTQILFGISGARWENDSNINKLKNEHWCRPSKKEKPANAHEVEDSCYW